MFGKCRACEAKDKHLAHLEAEVQMLRKLALPQTSAFEIPLHVQEADRVLSGSDEPINLQETDAQRELNSLISGSYDQVEVEA